jgi:putative transposase
MCSECGHILEKLSLSTREWVCPKCGTLHDRDLNASINLRNYPKSA